MPWSAWAALAWAGCGTSFLAHSAISWAVGRCAAVIPSIYSCMQVRCAAHRPPPRISLLQVTAETVHSSARTYWAKFAAHDGSLWPLWVPAVVSHVSCQHAGALIARAQANATLAIVLPPWHCLATPAAFVMTLNSIFAAGADGDARSAVLGTGAIGARPGCHAAKTLRSNVIMQCHHVSP